MLMLFTFLLGCGGGGGGNSNGSGDTPSEGSTNVVLSSPTGVAAVPSDGKVVLTWNAVSNAKSYRVKRASNSGGPYTQITTLASPPYTDTDCANGKTCYYVVSAANDTSESADSSEVMAMPVASVPSVTPTPTPSPTPTPVPGTPAATPVVSAPAAPTSPVASASDGQVALSWAASAGAVGYRVKRASTSGGAYSQIAAPTGTTYTDTGRTNGTFYYYVITAVNNVGESPNSAEVSARPVSATPVATAPGAPSGLSATAADAQVSLSWSAAATATGYRLKRATTAGGPYTQVAAPSGTSYVDAGRINGTTYYYVVSAVNGAGESANSSEIAATPKAAAPITSLPVLPENDPTKNYIGMNVWFLNDWDGSFAFVDAVKQARPWKTADWSNSVAVDALGWPTADASTVFFTGKPSQVNGTYKLVFNGQATVKLMWSDGTVTNQSYNAATNTTTADVNIAYNVSAGGSLGLVLTNTKRTASSATNTGFTNMHLYSPGYPADGSKVFTTPFLSALGKASAVRLMDWSLTNQNLTQHWAERITPAHMSKAGPAYTGPGGVSWSTSSTGVALEHQIQLCNALHVDCWINIPVVADDDFVRKIALALRYGTDGTNPYTSTQAKPVYPPLDPGLRIYVEYANEIWNSSAGFRCFDAIKDIVGTLPADHPLLTPAESSIWYKMWRYPAYRLAITSDIFRSVYGDASMMNRVRPVLMTQQGDGQATLQNALNWLDAYAKRQSPARSVNSYVYGAGGSGYYNVNSEPADKTDANAFFAAGNYPATLNVKGFGVDSVWAANFGLKHIAYEGGPSLDNYPSANARAINADPRMQDMVVKTHDAWSAQAGDLLMYYTLVGAGQWEFTPDITNTNTPKFNAISQLQLRPRAAVTLGQAFPGTIVATDQLAYRMRTGFDYATTCDTLACLGGNDPGEWIAFPGRASTAFTGNIVVNGISNAGSVINVWVNGVKRGQVTLAAGSHLINSTSLSTSIPAGLAVIRLEVVSGEFRLRSIAVN